MNEMIFDACISDACELIEKAADKLRDSLEYCECEDDKGRVKEAIYDLHLLHEMLV